MHLETIHRKQIGFFVAELGIRSERTRDLASREPFQIFRSSRDDDLVIGGLGAVRS